ncbi:MAG: EAL domain-containing protein [Wenzhouxiangella sp.]|nr:MAG: EAL domain-containing protein [Wenzhouxiangella sp.]
MRDKLITGLGLLLFLAADDVSATPLVAGGDHDFAPYEFIDERGQAAGLNVDLMRALARELGRDIEFRLGPWADSRERIVTGEIDVLPMYVAAFREPDLSFSTPHVMIYHEIFVRVGESSPGGLSDLVGRSVIVQRDAWVHERLLDEDFDGELVLVERERDALLLLASGQHDAALVSEAVGRRMLRELALDELTTSGGPLFPVEYALAIRSDQAELLGELNRGIERIRASGEFNELHQRWLGHERSVPQVVHSHRWAWLLLILLLAVIVLAWRWRRRAVRGAGTLADAVTVEQEFFTDSLTGLANRTGLERHLSCRLEQGSVKGGELALLHLDLDQFKLVNESGDHVSGDHVLQQIAALLVELVGPDGFLARPGGDEFCVVLDTGPLETLVEKAEGLCERLESQVFEAGEQRFRVTASIGVAALSGTNRSIAEALKRAEAACHLAKEGGRNRVHLYSDRDAAQLEHHGQMRRVQELSTALDQGGLSLYFQTIEPARPQGSTPLIVELLVRMTAEDGSIVAAGEFVPAAEKYFLAQRLDRWVVGAALDWLDANHHRLPQLGRAYINLSGRSLGDDRFLPFVLDQLDRHDVPASLIGFEITETAVMTHLHTGLATIEALRERGITFALDDFGVGVSSMAYLRELPVDVVKIDGSFARRAIDNPRERAVLGEINDLGKLLGKTTVVEQVETESARSIMAELGIDYVQGWAISRPRPLDELVSGGSG